MVTVLIITVQEALCSSAVEEAQRAPRLAKALWPVECRPGRWAIFALGTTPPSSSVYSHAHLITHTSLL